MTPYNVYMLSDSGYCFLSSTQVMLTAVTVLHLWTGVFPQNIYWPAAALTLQEMCNKLAMDSSEMNTIVWLEDCHHDEAV
jgi:hypothetical protein